MKKKWLIWGCLVVIAVAVFIWSDYIQRNKVVFTARVEGVYEGSLMVTTTDETGFDRASVSLADSARILNAAGTKVALFDIKAGDSVEITFNGYVLESYPVQIRADKIRIMAK